MTVKQQLLLMLQEAENLMLTQVTVDGKTFDEAELADAELEGCFEEMREKFNLLAQAIDYYAD